MNILIGTLVLVINNNVYVTNVSTEFNNVSACNSAITQMYATKYLDIEASTFMCLTKEDAEYSNYNENEGISLDEL